MKYLRSRRLSHAAAPRSVAEEFFVERVEETTRPRRRGGVCGVFAFCDGALAVDLLAERSGFRGVRGMVTVLAGATGFFTMRRDASCICRALRRVLLHGQRIFPRPRRRWLG
ncbi:hypothetical protein ABL57_03910 [Kocuria sp. SM24M-10]|nr:hypothetical protein ABL57_03910 [Kocuria sp. SM24M-10]